MCIPILPSSSRHSPDAPGSPWRTRLARPLPISQPASKGSSQNLPKSYAKAGETSPLRELETSSLQLCKEELFRHGVDYYKPELGQGYGDSILNPFLDRGRDAL